MDQFSLDQAIFSDRKSSFLIRASGKKKRDGIFPGDFLVIDRGLPHERGKLALVVRAGRFALERVDEELLRKNDPESGDFIWGMVRALVREVG